MSDVRYRIANDFDGLETVTVVVDGKPYVAASDHQNYDAIIEKARARDESVVELFDLSVLVKAKFERVSDRLSIKNGIVYFDGDPQDNALAGQIVAFYAAGVEDWKPLIPFYEKLAANPNEHSREQLFRWLGANGKVFTITEEGDIVGYKGVKTENGKYFSIKSGFAIVDDEEVNGFIPNEIGSKISMPRSKVQHDPNVGCSYGLHVGTFDYAYGWAEGAVLEVHVNPRDVVSVPTECDSAKLRTCAYTVVGLAQEKYDTPLVKTVVVNYEEQDDDWDDDDDDDDWDSCDCSDCRPELYEDEDDEDNWGL